MSEMRYTSSDSDGTRDKHQIHVPVRSSVSLRRNSQHSSSRWGAALALQDYPRALFPLAFVTPWRHAN